MSGLLGHAYPGEYMNRQQIATIYDSMAPEERNMPREQFIKQAMNTLDPITNSKILDNMVRQKRQATQGRIQKTQIDVALRERG